MAKKKATENEREEGTGEAGGETGGESISKAAAIREGFEKVGLDTPNADIADYVKRTHNLEVSPASVSVERSKLKAKAAEAPKKPRATKPEAAPTDTLPMDGIEAVKALCEKYGADQVKRLADLFG